MITVGPKLADTKIKLQVWKDLAESGALEWPEDDVCVVNSGNEKAMPDDLSKEIEDEISAMLHEMTSEDEK